MSIFTEVINGRNVIRQVVTIERLIKYGTIIIMFQVTSSSSVLLFSDLVLPFVLLKN